MRTFFKQFIFFSFFITALISCKNKEGERVELDSAKEVQREKAQMPDVADAVFADGMTGTVYQYYLLVEKALFQGDAEKVREAAKEMAEVFGTEWPELDTLAQQMTNSEDIEIQRRLFADLTAKLEPLFTKNLSEGTIYKQFCPMAFNGEGAYWFSGTKAIANPYFGKKMARCGKTVKTIKPQA